MFRILAFWTWTSGEVAAPIASAAGGMMMMHAGYYRRRYMMRETLNGTKL